MFNRQLLTRSTLSMAVLSACFIAATTHAGVFGVGGVASGQGGSLAGGLSGGFGARHLDAAGQGSGHLSRNGAMQPRGERARDAVGAGADKAVDAKQSAVERGKGRVDDARSGADQASGSANGAAAGSARTSRAEGSASADASAQGSVQR